MTGAEPRLVQADVVHAAVLADAFMDDPFMTWIFGHDRARRAAALPEWWGFIGQHAPDSAELWLIEEAAASLWYPPHHVGDEPEREPDAQDAGAPDDEDQLEQPDPFVEMLTPLATRPVAEILDMLGRGRELHPQEPHWYLLALGTRVANQGQGLGARLVRPVLDRCDREGLGAYLESSNPRNIPFYHRLGFEIVNESWTPDNLTVMTGMWRAPR